MALNFDYNEVKKFHDFYKSSDWKSIQRNSIPTKRDDILIMDFRDQIIIDDEVKLFYTVISQNIIEPRKFDCSIHVGSQSFELYKKTLKAVVSWVNTIFSQEHCIECKIFSKLDKDKKLCLNCYKKKCFKVNTGKTCSICLEDIEHDVFRTKCNHFFHFKCVMKLDKCPLCRFNFESNINWVPSDYQDEISDSDDIDSDTY